MFFTICCRTYRMHHQCYGSENFPNTIMLLKVDRFEEFLKKIISSSRDHYAIAITSDGKEIFTSGRGN